MCLILFAIQQHADYPLVVIANRDEYYERPTRAAHWWEDNPKIFAGRDLQAQGTWMGVDRQGRFAAVTNVREPGVKHDAPLSRGDLPANFLQSELSAAAYLDQLQRNQMDYAGFNLLLSDTSGCWFASNRSEGIRNIPPGLYGVSNGQFDEPWPKLETGKLALQKSLQSSLDIPNLLSILSDKDQATDESLPETGVSREFERLLSSRFIHSGEYGTRASSIVLAAGTTISVTEQNFDQSGAIGEAVTESFAIQQL